MALPTSEVLDAPCRFASPDSTHRKLAIVLPIVVGSILMVVIIAVVVCEKGKRQSTPPPRGPAPPVLELQTFPHQVPVPTQQPVAVVSNSPAQYAEEEPRVEFAGQTGRGLPPRSDADWMTYSDKPTTESHNPATHQSNLAQGENVYAPSPV